MKCPIYKLIAKTLDARIRCHEKNNQEWFARHTETLKELEKMLPSGSGIDCGTKISEFSTPRKIILTFSFHHMDNNGFYCGWTEHKAVITASLMFYFNLKITGPNKNQIKDYLYDVYDTGLRRESEWK